MGTNHTGRLGGMRRAVLAAGLCWSGVACGQLAIQDGFEAGVFAGAWTRTAGVNIQTGTGATGTARHATLPAVNNLGARYDAVNPGGAHDFYVDLYLRITNSTLRQFNLHISTSTGATGSGAPTVNLMYRTNTWQVFTGAWQTLAGLGPVTAGAWHRLRVTGTNWGFAGASYDIELSDAGGSGFTSSATGLQWFHNNVPTNATARYFNFTTDFGPSAAYDVDEVTAAITRGVYVEPDAVTNISGTYPHLSVFSADGEIGMGAVVPWADRVWFVTYPPHVPGSGSDKLWTIDTNLTLLARPESVGGTHANRLIHRESRQLAIGCYLVDTNGGVRVISRAAMPGRLTATARHPTDPTNKLFFATMEEGFYEVDVNTLAVTTLKKDEQTQTSGNGLILPGNHGKGCYAGQGRMLYANNGEPGWSVTTDPGFNNPAGLLTENAGSDYSNGWAAVERKNFTEITGPGGILGATNDSDAIWALGWDKRSVLLKLLDAGTWHDFRLPKGSYTHDAFHGWYTEWPRIREISPGTLLMHMHGLFYEFPKTFSAANTAGLSPLCTYLTMPVDYGWWEGRIVMGRDVTSTTGGNIWAGQSHSAPWFGQVDDLRQWGAPEGCGGPWKNDAVTGGNASTPFLVAGFQRRVLHLRQGTTNSVNFALEGDASGAGAWSNLATIAVASNGYAWFVFPSSVSNVQWVRLTPDRNATNVTAYFHLRNERTAPDPALFAGLAAATTNRAGSDGIIRPQGGSASNLQFAANLLDASGAVTGTGYYEIGGPLKLRVTNNAAAEATLRGTYSLSNADFSVDSASVLYTEGASRFRLPKSLPAYDTAAASGWPRGKREVITERLLFNAHGTFYELPYSTSGGFRRIRPVATHNRRISDFASWRGLLVIAGVTGGVTNDAHIFRSDDGQAALWLGGVDDLWRLGAPTGSGGPWLGSAVTNGVPGDPFLMYGYERKQLALSHGSASPVTFTVEVDVCADNTWSEYGRFTVPPGETLQHVFPDGYSAHWVRIKADATTVATAQFTYSAPPPPGYAQWAAGHALAAGPAGDEDGDGYANLLEYATGGSPTNADGMARLRGALTNTALALLFARDTNAVDASLVVEAAPAATNGASWRGIATNRGGVWSGPAAVSETTGANPVQVAVTDVEPAATNRFLRLRVTLP